MAYSELPWRPFLGHQAWSWTTLRRGNVFITFTNVFFEFVLRFFFFNVFKSLFERFLHLWFSATVSSFMGMSVEWSRRSERMKLWIMDWCRVYRECGELRIVLPYWWITNKEKSSNGEKWDEGNRWIKRGVSRGYDQIGSVVFVTGGEVGTKTEETGSGDVRGIIRMDVKVAGLRWRIREMW